MEAARCLQCFPPNTKVDGGTRAQASCTAQSLGSCVQVRIQRRKVPLGKYQKCFILIDRKQLLVSVSVWVQLSSWSLVM